MPEGGLDGAYGGRLRAQGDPFWSFIYFLRCTAKVRTCEGIPRLDVVESFAFAWSIGFSALPIQDEILELLFGYLNFLRNLPAWPQDRLHISVEGVACTGSV